MSERIRAIHCINQFFGGLGGEEQADLEPQWFEGPRGPGSLLQRLAPEIEIIATVVFGDNYVAEDPQQRAGEVVALIETELESLPGGKPQLLLAGPAFHAGRYGMACAAICERAAERLEIAVVTGMFAENPAVDSYRQSVTIVRTGADVMDMRNALEAMARVGTKLVRSQPVTAEADACFARGLRKNYFAEDTGARRAITMLRKKLRGEAFATEYTMPVFSRVTPAPPVRDLAQATLALVTSGGIVPRGNPDRIESASASKYGRYPLAGLERLSADTHQTVHGGYDPSYANADPNRVLPLDEVRQLERQGVIGRLYDYYFATVGNATSVAQAKKFGEEIAATLVNVGVQAVILTST